MPDPRNVVVYSRKGCHLCELVKESLSKLSRRGGFTWQEIDVDGDSELRRQYNDEVPVVFIDGRAVVSINDLALAFDRVFWHSVRNAPDAV